MGKRSDVKKALRFANLEFRAAKADKIISEKELSNIVKATFELKALGAGERHLNKADKIFSKAVKWFSKSNTTEVVNEVIKEVEVVKEVEAPCETVYVDREVMEVEVIKEVEIPGDTVYVDREVVKEVPLPYFVDNMEFGEYGVNNEQEEIVVFSLK